jgi:hypothetical protein
MTEVRHELHRYMVATIADENKHHNWFYRAVRPMSVPPKWSPGTIIRGDCSKGVQYLCRWAGGSDPMKMNYGAWGNSTTLCHNLQHLDHATDLLIGDIVTFGVDGSKHATMVMETGDNPLLWSFGHQGAPNMYRLSEDNRPHQFLRNPLPKYIPTPQEQLKKKKGYFAWVAWKLGEGDWFGHGKANSKLRPNVPKLIPIAWWKRYASFLVNRNKGDAPSQ